MELSISKYKKKICTKYFDVILWDGINICDVNQATLEKYTSENDIKNFEKRLNERFLLLERTPDKKCL